MLISEIDFGPRDARHAYTEGTEDEKVFSKIFINPYGIDEEQFLDGRSCFIFGIKGSGKSAFLRNLNIKLKGKAFTDFVYFSDSIRDIDKTNRNHGDSVETIEPSLNKDPDEYWSSFFFLLIARILYSNQMSTSKHFLEFVRRQTTNAPNGIFDKIFGQAPTLQKWSAQISNAPRVDLLGNFEKVVNIEHFYDSAVSLLSDIHFKKPIYILVDELEVAFKTSEQFDKDTEVARSLVRNVRDFNEKFRAKGIPIYLICAIRTEVAKNVVGGETQKIVQDKGQAIIWERSAKSTEDEERFHPLFEIVLNRIFFSQNPKRDQASISDLKSTAEKIFPFYVKTKTENYILDLTTYRPRDISILFSEAQSIDKNRDHFELNTFRKKIRTK